MTDLDVHRFAFPTDVRFGAGALAELPGAVRAHMQRPLVVTDEGLARLPVFEQVRGTLAGAGIDAPVYSNVQGNPTAENVEGALDLYRERGCDGVIGVGGGSGLDAAKAIALMGTHAGTITDYDEGHPDCPEIRPDVAPTIAIPTTAGTGSEVGRSAVITNVATRQKAVIFSPHLLPRVAVVDPTLMLGLPPGVTAATGMDALTHNVEAFLARGYHPLCDGIALEGIRQCDRFLRRAVADGQDLEARTGMAIASLMGAVAFQKGLGATHSLAHPLSTVSGMHHGLANGILVARVMEWNADACGERLARIGLVLGGAAAGLSSEADLGRHAIDSVATLARDVGMPATLPEAGVDPADLDTLADLAAVDGCHQLNPKPVSRDDFRALYAAAM